MNDMTTVIRALDDALAAGILATSGEHRFRLTSDRQQELHCSASILRAGTDRGGCHVYGSAWTWKASGRFL
jgi:hypothetical protein